MALLDRLERLDIASFLNDLVIDLSHDCNRLECLDVFFLRTDTILHVSLQKLSLTISGSSPVTP